MSEALAVSNDNQNAATLALPWVPMIISQARQYAYYACQIQITNHCLENIQLHRQVNTILRFEGLLLAPQCFHAAATLMSYCVRLYVPPCCHMSDMFRSYRALYILNWIYRYFTEKHYRQWLGESKW